MRSCWLPGWLSHPRFAVPVSIVVGAYWNWIYFTSPLGESECLLCFGLVAQSQSARFALVIGNGNYAELGHLANPANDATDMAAALKNLGFDTDLLVDADLDSMEGAVVRLGNKLGSISGSTGFFYYAGHGVQSGGINYLIPSDARIPSESFLRTKALAAQEVLDTMQNSKNGLNIVVLDACRDNPFSWSRSGTRGLTVIGTQPTGSIIVYATSAGSVAQDGTGRNGVFTQELLKNLANPDLEIKEVFNRTGADVQSVTDGKQVPVVYNQFYDKVYLSRGSGKTADLMVKASEPGAEIFVDGIDKGQAPLLVQGLPCDQDLKIEARTDSQEGSLKLNLKAGKQRVVSISMLPMTGSLVIGSSKSAVRVLLDGADKGALGSGVLKGVAVGSHHLELVGVDLYCATTVDITPDEVSEVDLKPLPVGSLEIKAPDGVASVITGEDQNWTITGPGTIDRIPSARYTIRTRRDYYPWSRVSR